MPTGDYMTKTLTWRRGIAEGVLILGSILVAFWIDAWWENRKARELESDALSAVLAEVEENLRKLDQVNSSTELQLDAVDRFLRAGPDELKSLAPDTVRIWIGHMMRPSTFDADRAAATVLATLPVSSDPGSAQARRLVSRLQSQLERAERVSEGVGDSYTTVREHLARYASQSAVNGRAYVASMVAQVGPDILAQLRRDDEFVAAVIDKAHVQSVYQDVLEGIAEALNSLSVVLDKH